MLPNSSTGASDFKAYVREGTAAVTCSTASSSSDYNSPGGGDVTLNISGSGFNQTNPNPLSFVKAGNWLMLCRNVKDANGNPYPVFNWYRVVSADLIDETAQTTTQNVTLAGPDWDFSATGGANAEPTYACLFDGVVAVYERTIKLEGASEWSQ